MMEMKDKRGEREQQRDSRYQRWAEHESDLEKMWWREETTETKGERET